MRGASNHIKPSLPRYDHTILEWYLENSLMYFEWSWILDSVLGEHVRRYQADVHVLLDTRVSEAQFPPECTGGSPNSFNWCRACVGQYYVSLFPGTQIYEYGFRMYDVPTRGIWILCYVRLTCFNIMYYIIRICIGGAAKYAVFKYI